MNLFLYWINENGGRVTQNMRSLTEWTVGTVIHKIIIGVQIINFLITMVQQKKCIFSSENWEETVSYTIVKEEILMQLLVLPTGNILNC